MEIYNDTTIEETRVTEFRYSCTLLVAFLSFGCCSKNTDSSHLGNCLTVDAAGDPAQTNPGAYNVKEEKNSAVSEEGLNSMVYRTSKTKGWNY